MNRRISLALSLLFILANAAQAKRGPAPEVPPVAYGRMEFRVPNTLENMGIVEVWNPGSGEKQQDLRVYRVTVWPWLEADAQWIFIKSMVIEKSALVVTTERDKVYRIPFRLIRHAEPTR